MYVECSRLGSWLQRVVQCASRPGVSPNVAALYHPMHYVSGHVQPDFQWILVFTKLSDTCISLARNKFYSKFGHGKGGLPMRLQFKSATTRRFKYDGGTSPPCPTAVQGPLCYRTEQDARGPQSSCLQQRDQKGAITIRRVRVTIVRACETRVSEFGTNQERCLRCRSAKGHCWPVRYRLYGE